MLMTRRSPVPLSSALFRLAILASCLVASFPASADLGHDPALSAVDAHLAVLSGKSAVVDAAHLVGNDQTRGATFTVLTPPPMTAGDWTVDPSGAVHFTPYPSFRGTASMTYELQAGGETASGRVTFHVAAPIVPIAGRWPTADCRPGECEPRAVLGHGAELGVFDARDGRFSLCDWRGSRTLHDCFDVTVPDAEEVVAWTPLVLDRDGDGFSELLLRDPTSGETRVYALVGNDAAEGTEAPGSWVLTRIETLLFGLPSNLPLGGTWDGGLDHLGVFVAGGVESKFLLDGMQSSFAFAFAADGRPAPLAGDWIATGSDQVGVVDLDALQGLRFVDPRAPHDIRSFDPAAHGAKGILFSGRVWSADSRSFLGAFDSAGPSFRLLGFWPESATGDSGSERTSSNENGPLPLDVLVDPPTLAGHEHAAEPNHP